MRAAVIADGAITIRDVADPAPGPGELLVRVASAGINAADLLQRAGFYPAPPGSPSDIPGMEFAGVVEAVGPDTSHWKGGDRVMAIVGGGAQAELVVVHSSHALAVPDGADLVAAGGFPEAFSTAHDALVSQGRLQSGERVLVTGAAGGVGTAGIQLAHALGAHVTASARDPARHDALIALGADEVIVPEQMGDAGTFDVVLELIGAASLAEVQAHLAKHARVVVIGVGGGGRVEVNLLGMMVGRWTLLGSTLRSRTIAEKATVAEGVRRDVLDFFADGELVVPVDRSVSLADVETAYDAFAAGGKFGKIILTVDG